MIPRCIASRTVFAAAQQPFKGLALACRPLQTGRPSPSTAGVAAATDHETIRPYEEIPGPKPLPILGNAWRFLPGIGEFANVDADDLSQQMHAKYGPISRFSGIPGRRDMVFIFRPEDVETAFRNEGPWPHREGIQAMEYYRNVTRRDFYQGAGSLLTDHGAKWGDARSKVNQPMMQPRISKKYVPPIAGVAQEFIDKMRAMRDEKDELPPDFVNELFKWSLESIAYVALDTRLGCLEPNLSPDSEPQRIIDAVNAIFQEMFTLEFGLPYWKLFRTPSWKKFVKAHDVFLEVSVKYVQATIDRAERRKKEGLEEEEGEPSVLERLLVKADPKAASIMAQDMLFAGVDTTSYSTAIAMYMLSKNKDKQEVLFGELKRFMPRKDSPITEEMLEEMKYLKAVIKECMRVQPIVGANMRKTVKEIVLCNYKIPQEVDVVMPNLTFRHSEDIYPQGKRFIPERWLKTRPSGDEAAGSTEDFDAVSHGKRHPFAFLPFGFGPRSCVGKRFAELEMEILLAKVIRNFYVDYRYDDFKYVSKMLITPTNPLQFQLKDRSE